MAFDIIPRHLFCVWQILMIPQLVDLFGREYLAEAKGDRLVDQEGLVKEKKNNYIKKELIQRLLCDIKFCVPCVLLKQGVRSW